MKRTSHPRTAARALFFLGFFCLFLGSSNACAGPFDVLQDLMRKAPDPGGASALDDKTAVAGLREALAVGTKNAVRSVSKADGYLGNRMIKILLPENLQKVVDVAARLGFQKQVDSLVVSMNRAAEAAAPQAADLFAQAIREMTFDDARGILKGGDTAATAFFREKTSAQLYETFKPVVSTKMGKVGVAQAYRELMEPVSKVPFLKAESTDLDHYVTNKALDGLFLMIGEEEKKIRTDPAARVTGLLKTVFGH